jgi:hypothetical protein
MKRKPKPLTLRVAKKRIAELEKQVADLQNEKVEAQRAVVKVLGLDVVLDRELYDLCARVEELEARFW